MANEFRKVTDQNGVDHPVCDDTRVDWESYAKTGVHQLLKYDLASLKAENTNGTWAGNVYTISDMTFTVESNKSISLSGTPSADVFFNVASAFTIKAGSYTKSGCPEGGSSSTYWFGGNSGAEYGDGVGIDIPSDTSKSFIIAVKSGTDMTGKVFLPLLKYASDKSNAFSDYAMTNGELTENFPTAYSTSGLVFTNCTYVSGGYAKVGKLCVVNIRVLTDADMTGKDISITGFPSYSGSLNNKNIVPCNTLNMSDDSNTNYYSAIGYTGNMNVHNSSNNIVPSKEYAISATYLCG